MRYFLQVRVPLLALAVSTSACASGNLLHEYDYRDSTLGVVSEVPYRPDVLSGSLFDLRSSGDPLRRLEIWPYELRRLLSQGRDNSRDDAQHLIEIFPRAGFRMPAACDLAFDCPCQQLRFNVR